MNKKVSEDLKFSREKNYTIYLKVYSGDFCHNALRLVIDKKFKMKNSLNYLKVNIIGENDLFVGIYFLR